MNPRSKRILISVYVIVIGLLILRADPDILKAFSISPYQPRPLSTADVVLPSFLGKLSERSPKVPQVTSVFRGNRERTGNYVAALSAYLTAGWSWSPLNLGIHGASKSSPAVDESGIYVGTDNGYFLAFNHQGQLRWQIYLADSPRGIHDTAAMDEDTVYFGGYNGVLYALDKQNGQIRWTKKVGGALGSSPVLDDGALYIGVETGDPNGFLLKVRARDGEMLWASDWLGEQTHSSPTLSLDHQIVMIGSNHSNFHAFDMQSGKLKWTRTLLAEMKSTAPVVDGIAFVTSWEGRLLALDVRNGRQLWSQTLHGMSQVSATYLPQAKLIVAADHSGVISAFELRTGKQRWSISSGIKRLISSGAATWDGKREIFWNTCAEKTLCAIDAASGTILSRTSLAAVLTGQPVPYGSSLFVALDGKDGGLYQFKKRVTK